MADLIAIGYDDTTTAIQAMEWRSQLITANQKAATTKNVAKESTVK